MSNYNIVPVFRENIGEYAEVIRQSFATVAKEFGLTKENCPSHTSFISDECLTNKFKDEYYPFGLTVEDKIVGCVSLTDMSGGIFEISNLSVLPEYRHYGYGKAMMDFCKDEARKLGGTKIKIGIVEENTRLKDWYAACGFIHTGTHKFEHLPFTVGFMERDIKANDILTQNT